MRTRRFLVSVIGTPDSRLNDDLQEMADEQGVYFIEGKGMYICTFYTDYTLDEVFEFLSYNDAIMIFDITEQENFAIQLPTKYHLGLFPEIQKVFEGLKTHKVGDESSTKEKKSDELYTIDDILDKLSKNNYDRSCLTQSELNILKNHS